MLRTNYRAHLIAACAAVVLAVSLVACGGGDSSSSTAAGEQPTAAGATRTVRVFVDEPVPSPSDATGIHAGLEKGRLPAGTVEGTVLTDEDCAPDREGISHCRNAVRLADGGTVVLRHYHEMAQVPCLAPGERVLLRRA